MTVAHAAVATHAQQLATIATAAGAKADAKPDEIVVALHAQGVKTGLQEVIALQAQVNTLTTQRARDIAIAAIDKAAAEGKPIPPTRREELIALHMKDPAGTETWLGMMTSLHAGGLGGRGGPALPTTAGLDQVDMEVIARMGLDPVAYAKTKGVEIAAGAGA